MPPKYAWIAAPILFLAIACGPAPRPAAPASTPGPMDTFPAVREVLKGNNNDRPPVPKLRDFQYAPGTGFVDAAFNIDDNLTIDMVRGGIQTTMSDTYTALYHGDGPLVRSATIHAWGPVRDKFGNSAYAELVSTRLDAALAQRVNWKASQTTLELDVIPGLWTTVIANPSLGWPAR